MFALHGKSDIERVVERFRSVLDRALLGADENPDMRRLVAVQMFDLTTSIDFEYTFDPEA